MKGGNCKPSGFPYSHKRSLWLFLYVTGFSACTLTLHVGYVTLPWESERGRRSPASEPLMLSTMEDCRTKCDKGHSGVHFQGQRCPESLAVATGEGGVTETFPCCLDYKHMCPAQELRMLAWLW